MCSERENYHLHCCVLEKVVRGYSCVFFYIHSVISSISDSVCISAPHRPAQVPYEKA